MSIPLNSIDCPCLTYECLENLNQYYSVNTTNEFFLWLINSNDKTQYFTKKTIECICSCIIVQTGNIENRKLVNTKTYELNYSLFSNENLFENNHHLLFIYESFNQSQWNHFFNYFLLRLCLYNSSVKIQYINTNASLFDLNYFYSYYCCLNENLSMIRDDLFDKSFFYEQCFHLDSFENQLNLMEKNDDLIQILIIDDLFSLIRPYLGLDRRIKDKFLQITYRLNRLAQKQSLLIITGLILNSKIRINNFDENFRFIFDQRFESFHADRYILFQSLTSNENEICLRIINENSQETSSYRSRLRLDNWTNLLNKCKSSLCQQINKFKNNSYYIFTGTLKASCNIICLFLD